MDNQSAAQIFRAEILKLSGITEDVQEKDETEAKAVTRKKKVEPEPETDA